MKSATLYHLSEQYLDCDIHTGETAFKNASASDTTVIVALWDSDGISEFQLTPSQAETRSLLENTRVMVRGPGAILIGEPDEGMAAQ